MQNDNKDNWIERNWIVIPIVMFGVAFVVSALDRSSQPVSTTKTNVLTTPQAQEIRSGVTSTSVSAPSSARREPISVPLSNNNYYTNTYGNRVHSPAYAPSVPAGASAECRDGTYSFSHSRQGTCSHHGGVDRWL